MYTTLNYHSQKGGEAFLSFNPEAQVTENLTQFGEQLKQVFLKVHTVTTMGQSQRERFFGKAKDKIEDEIRLMKKGQELIDKTKTDIEGEDARKAKLLAQKQAEDQARLERDLANQKLIAEQNKIKQQLQEQLEVRMLVRATFVIQILASKGIKKIGKTKIVDMLNNQSLIKYDQVMTFYQNHIKKEKELIEENKKKKLKDVELLLRSQREEEKIVIEKFANEKADKEME